MATPVYATWNATTAYAAGDVVTDLGLDYVATANNINSQPGFTILWTLLPPPGGVTTLSVAGDDVIANPGGSAADISTTTTVAATAVKTTQVSYDSGILLTTVAGDFDIKNGITQQILLATSGDITATGTVEPATITDSVGSQGAAGQVLTAGAGSELLWAAGGSGTVIPGPEQTYSSITTTTGTTVTRTSFTYTAGGQDAFATTPLALNTLQNVFLTFKPPVVAVGDFLSIGFSVPSTCGFLIYTNSLVPVFNGVASFGDAIPFVAGDNASLAVTATRVSYCLNGVPIHVVAIAGTVPPSTIWTSLANTAVGVPYAFTDVLFYSTPSSSTAGSVSVQGLFNKLAIVSAAGPTVTDIYYAGGTGVGYPSSWIPDTTPNTAILPAVTGSNTPWRLTKVAGAPGVGTRWWVYPYNPQYGNTPPYTITPSSNTFLKKNLRACWALVTYKGSVPLNPVQGSFFFNIYTYDYANIPPAAQAYSTRFDYNANNLALPLTTGAGTLQGEYTYLVYCLDADKIVANPALGTTITQANGQTPNQLTTEMLRDPYDIETDRNHVGLSAVAYTAGGAIVPSDINNVPVLSIALACSSSSLTSGADFQVRSIGYIATAQDGSTINRSFILSYSP